MIDLYPYVTAKKAALANVVPEDVQKLQLESASLAVQIAAAPSHANAPTLKARQTAIAELVRVHE